MIMALHRAESHGKYQDGLEAIEGFLKIFPSGGNASALKNSWEPKFQEKIQVLERAADLSRRAEAEAVERRETRAREQETSKEDDNVISKLVNCRVIMKN